MMRSWQLLVEAAEAKYELQRSEDLRRWARRMRSMAERESNAQLRATLLSLAEDYDRIADSVDSINRSKEWIKKPAHPG